jgi:transcription factor IIIB subunit 2
MGFDGEYAHDTGDGETFEGGYDYADYNKDGYADGTGAGAYNDYDELDF